MKNLVIVRFNSTRFFQIIIFLETILFVGHGSSLDACTRLITGGQSRNTNDFYDILQRTPYLSTIQLNDNEKKYEIAGSPIPPLKHSVNNEYDFKIVHKYA